MSKPISRGAVSFRDYSNEISHTRYNVATLTPGNFAAVTANMATLNAAIVAVTLGRLAKHEIVAVDAIDSALPGATVDSQREKKWLLRYHDSLGSKFKMEIPCADLSILATNSDFADPANAAVIALAAAFNGFVISPDDVTLSCTFDSLQFVGRNL